MSNPLQAPPQFENDLSAQLREERRQNALLLDSVVPIGLALLRETDLPRLLEMILCEAQRLASADGATLYMRKNDTLEFFMARNTSLGLKMGGVDGPAVTFAPLHLMRQDTGEPNLTSAACYSALRHETLNLEDIHHNTKFDFIGSRRFDELHDYHTYSLLTVPLSDAEGATVAVLQLINAVDPKTGAHVAFAGSVQKVVEALAALAAGALESFAVKARLYEEQQRYLRNLETTQERLRSELSEAERYVRAILPPPEEGPPLKIEWLLAPCSELGGDSFGYHKIDPDHWAFYILDVCGHGVGAALLSVTAIKVLRASALPSVDFRDPGQVLTALNNQFLMRNQNNIYFTIWYGVYRISTRELRFANAGHAPAILADTDAGKATRISAPGMVLGAVENKVYRTHGTILPPGAILYLISDGTYEIRLADGTMWPFDQFLRLLGNQPPGEPGTLQGLHDQISAQRHPHRLEDDFSVVRVFTGRARQKYFSAPTTLEGILEPMHDALAFLKESGACPHALFVGELVLEEILTNIAKYAHDEPAGHRIDLHAMVGDGNITLEFRDDGRPFDPLKAPAPTLGQPVKTQKLGGRGLFLVRKHATEKLYRREANQNILTLGFPAQQS
jgi:serine phosphatase RsbU (regulator of sigma subunit)/anti-sigma regulatory factor (Ser/Thr protein kinase)